MIGLAPRRRRSPSSPRAVSSPRPAAQTRGRGRKPSPQADVWAGTKHPATSNFPPVAVRNFFACSPSTFCPEFVSPGFSSASLTFCQAARGGPGLAGTRGRRGRRGGREKGEGGEEEGAAAAVREEELVKGDTDRRAPEKESDAAVCCSRDKVRALSSGFLPLTAGRWQPPPPPRPHPPGGAKVVFPSPPGAARTVTGRGGVGWGGEAKYTSSLMKPLESEDKQQQN